MSWFARCLWQFSPVFLLLLFLLLMWPHRVLEGGPSERQHLLGVSREDPEWDEGLPKVCCRRISQFGHLCCQCSSVCGSSLHSGHVGSAAGSSKWVYALRSGVCPDRRRARERLLPCWRWRCSLSSRSNSHTQWPVGRRISEGGSVESFRGGK